MAKAKKKTVAPKRAKRKPHTLGNVAAAKARQRDALKRDAAKIDAVAKPGHHPDQPTRMVRDIKRGSRHRLDYGDLNTLARSIIDRGGLLQPIVITAKNELIAGDRRLRAWGLTPFKNEPIPVHVVDIDSIVNGEWDENAQRKDFTPSEAVAIKRAMEPAERLKAKGRQGKRGQGDGTKSADNVAAFVGRDRKTIGKAEAVVDAAERDPKRFGPLKEQMDKSGKVNGPFSRLQIMLQTDAIKQAPAGVPMKGPYGGLVIDFPWPTEPEAEQEDIDARGRSTRPYPAMSIKAGCLFLKDQVATILAPDCVVGMCTTNFHMPYAFELLNALGFHKHSSILTWDKVHIGRGQVLREQTEHVIIATRGKPVVNLTNETTLLRAPRRENSQKPDEFFELFERVFPAARYAEIFSRGGRSAKWDCHGDQIGKFPPMVAAAAVAEVMAENAGATTSPFSVFWPSNVDVVAALTAVQRNEPVENVKMIAHLIEEKFITGRGKLRLSAKGDDELVRLNDQIETDRLAELPEDIDALVTLYREAIATHHAAVMAKDGPAQDASFARLDLLQRKANGGDNFGMAVDSSPAERLRAESAAVLGQIPMWAQRGMFRLLIDDVPHLVSYDGGGFGVHAEDPDKPFLSNTGYRSCFFFSDAADEAVAGLTVAEAVERTIRHDIAFDTSHNSGKPKPRKKPFGTPEKVYRLPAVWLGDSPEPALVSKKAARERLAAEILDRDSGNALATQAATDEPHQADLETAIAEKSEAGDDNLELPAFLKREQAAKAEATS